MAYDEGLAQRIREELEGMLEIVEKKLFGGVCFLLRGNMACGVHKNTLIVRVGSLRYAEAVAKPYARKFDTTGKPMAGWVTVDPAGFESDNDLREWLRLGTDYAETLKAK